jgi:hypothetical protein
LNNGARILQRKRLKISDFADKKALSERLQAFISQWNTKAHPFDWSEKSTLKVIAKCKIPSANFTTQIDLAIREASSLRLIAA